MNIWVISELCNCYVIAGEQNNKAAVVDPGASFQNIMSLVDAKKLDVTHILLTHGHYDHIEAVAALSAATGAAVYIHPGDSECLSKPSASLNPWRTDSEIKIDYPTNSLSDGLNLQIGELNVDVLHTPGHTRGSCTFACEDVLFTGDTLFAGDCGRWDFPGGDRNVLMASLTRLSTMDGTYIVYPGHGQNTSLAQEKINNPYFHR